MPIQSLTMKGGAWRRHALATAMLALSAGATLAQPAPPATPAAAGSGTNGPAAGAPARPPADPAALKPFDEVVKGAMSGYVFENLEIASYTVLIEAAKVAGDVETQRACEQILPQEIAMAEWLREHLPEITQAFLERSASPHTEAKR